MTWKLGSFKSPGKWQDQMGKRGWTMQMIDDAITKGRSFPAVNKINPGHAATRYVNPLTGRSVVVDDANNEVIHVGGDGFVY